MISQFPASFSNQLEMLRCIECNDKKNRALRKKTKEENQWKEQEIVRLKKEAQEKAEEIDQLNIIHSSEVDQFKLQLRDVNSQNQELVTKREADITDTKTKIAVYEGQVKNNDIMLQQLETKIAKEREESDRKIVELVKQREQLEVQLAKEREHLEIQLYSKGERALRDSVSKGERVE